MMAISPEHPDFPHETPAVGQGHDTHANVDAEAYQRGTMSITEQGATWTLFMNLAKWGSLTIASILLFLVLWFQPGGSFFVGLIAGVVVFAAGVVFLRSGAKGH